MKKLMKYVHLIKYLPKYGRYVPIIRGLLIAGAAGAALVGASTVLLDVCAVNDALGFERLNECVQ